MRDIIEVLLDRKNSEAIVLTDERGREVYFEQVAVIPREGELYCILKPLTYMQGVADDEAIVFCAEQPKRGAPYLRMEDDEHIVLEIFEEYYSLLERA